VHQGAIDVLGPVVEPRTVHQSKFSMGTVLALIALRHSAGLDEFETALDDGAVAAFRGKVTMALDAEVDAAYPVRWIGKVTVHTVDGRVLQGRVDEPKGDPGNTLSRAELEDKAHRLAAFGGVVSQAQMASAIAAVWNIADAARVPSFFAP
jgi:2-methylcitrate dehydratase PrpD